MIDYRNYDSKKPNREEYYQIPNKLQELIDLFMKKVNLQTGSLDFILTTKGEYVFLEVNPCGQYDIFNLCNINPDKLIAEHLIKKNIMNVKNNIKIRTPFLYAYFRKASVIRIFCQKINSEFYQTPNHEIRPFYKSITSLL